MGFWSWFKSGNSYDWVGVAKAQIYGVPASLLPDDMKQFLKTKSGNSDEIIGLVPPQMLLRGLEVPVETYRMTVSEMISWMYSRLTPSQDADRTLFHCDDLWQTPAQTLKNSISDCEDWAILFKSWCIMKGILARVCVGTLIGRGHAWNLLYQQGKTFLIDVIQGWTTLKEARTFTGYVPLWSFDETSCFVHGG